MSDNEKRPLPTNSIQAVGRVAEDVLDSLKLQPTLLAMMILNVTFAALAAWFLLSQEGYRHTERLEFIELLRACMVPSTTT